MREPLGTTFLIWAMAVLFVIWLLSEIVRLWFDAASYFGAEKSGVTTRKLVWWWLRSKVQKPTCVCQLSGEPQWTTAFCEICEEHKRHEPQ